MESIESMSGDTKVDCLFVLTNWIINCHLANTPFDNGKHPFNRMHQWNGPSRALAISESKCLLCQLRQPIENRKQNFGTKPFVRSNNRPSQDKSVCLIRSMLNWATVPGQVTISPLLFHLSCTRSRMLSHKSQSFYLNNSWQAIRVVVVVVMNVGMQGVVNGSEWSRVVLPGQVQLMKLCNRIIHWIRWVSELIPRQCHSNEGKANRT